MSRYSLSKMLEGRLICCPRCKSGLRSGDEAAGLLQCENCQTHYPTSHGIPGLVLNSDGLTKEIQQFWGHLYESAYSRWDRKMNPEQLEQLLHELEKMFRHRLHLAATAINLPNIQSARLLEVGCGAGAHSVLFNRMGAEVFALDLTPERVAATAAKMDLVSGEVPSLVAQGDARELPFADGFFDIVYSNGVLHHTSAVQTAVDEIYRVLKPGGHAAVMLYARNSFLYWGVLLPVRGILMGGLFRNRNWLGRATEWMSEKKQEVFNPRTEVFSEADVRDLFHRFRKVEVRKNSFQFDQIPLVGKWIGRLAGIITGYNQGGILVYGFPWRLETRVELWLGRRVGFDLNILAIK